MSFETTSQNTIPDFSHQAPLIFDTIKLLIACFFIANFITPLYNQSSIFIRVSVRYASPLNYQPNEPLQRIACGAR
ncbi:hypothetical protein [Undibacterium rugosum]|uniref:hypothetical protein n=1 Tax=Undibacterium rugosum TaxID=2762291 RepID=UPI001B810F71|nr:hypothetical protein [Undibacterium rugosum]MBR7780425.1 hypothetical protein [Undibacterium rugosum]